MNQTIYNTNWITPKSYNETPMQDVFEGANEISSSEKRFQNYLKRDQNNQQHHDLNLGLSNTLNMCKTAYRVPSIMLIRLAKSGTDTLVRYAAMHPSIRSIAIIGTDNIYLVYINTITYIWINVCTISTAQMLHREFMILTNPQRYWPF